MSNMQEELNKVCEAVWDPISFLLELFRLKGDQFSVTTQQLSLNPDRSSCDWKGADLDQS